MSNYIVKQGDTLYNIAKDNNLTVDELIRLNPQTKKNINLIHIGDELRLAPNKIKERINIREERQRERELNKDNVSAIQGYRHNGNYVIIDKKNRKFTVYDKDNNELYTTSDFSIGKSGNDYNTVTYTDENEHIIEGAGNESTPAGILEISGKGQYHGYPSFTRARLDNQGNVRQVPEIRKNKETNEWYRTGNMIKDNVASSLHWGNIGKEKNASNGCVRIGGKTLKDLSEYLEVGSRIYTLPEKEGSKFTLRGGKLNFTANNPYGDIRGDVYDVKTRRKISDWDDYNITIDKSYNPLSIEFKRSNNEEYNKNVRDFLGGIVNNKKVIQETLGLTSAEYNKLAELAIGIAEQESKFGTSKRYKIKQSLGEPNMMLLKGLHDFKNPLNVAISRGYTQIKNKGDSKELQNLYKKFNIDDKSIKTAEGSSVATILRLAYMYNTEVKGKQFTSNDGKILDPYHALLYKWNGHNEQIVNKTFTPEKNIYIRNVNNYARNFDLYETREYDEYKLGGRHTLEYIDHR